MPYTAELSRNNPTSLIFLIDQSSSMAEPFGAQPEKPKAEGVADGINRLLQNLVLKCAKGDGIRDYFHVGVIGYGSRVAWAIGGKLAGQKLVPISIIANNPLKVEQRTRKVDDGAGGLVEQKFKFPVWFEPVAVGRTPMCKALTEATMALEEFIGRFPDAFPPLVINISDGKVLVETGSCLRRLVGARLGRFDGRAALGWFERFRIEPLQRLAILVLETRKARSIPFLKVRQAGLFFFLTHRSPPRFCETR